MQCSEETIARLFYNASSSFFLLFFFFYFTSIFLTRAFNFLGGNLFFPRSQNDYEFGAFSDEEEEEEEEEEENRFFHEDSARNHHYDLEANIVDGNQNLFFMPTKVGHGDHHHQIHENQIHEDHQTAVSPDENEALNHEECCDDSEQELSVYSSPALESFEEEVSEEDHPQEIPPPSHHHHVTNQKDPTKVAIQLIKDEKRPDQGKNLNRDDENYLVFAPSKVESKKLMIQPQPQGKENIINCNKNNEVEDIFGDTCTVGSTSKSSSEWRSSIKDSGTDDPFSSSSRRSCPKWESYTVFQKYDEEMLFLDRISAQKLHETESLRSIQACPRSISERIIHKMGTKHKTAGEFRHNPYHELEATYVAQICLTWEALNWNYKYFQRLRASRRENDAGCPAYVAQQFQQFLVLLQRYVENEPYEHGRRPEIYARMRRLAPKLLQVPEYRDSEEEKKEESIGSRISSDSFLLIMEESIRTFMNFLKADRESRCQILAALLKRARRGLPDADLLLLLKKVNKKKKTKLKELRHSGNCCIRKRRLKLEEEMEILMALVDLKVVSRVLRMRELTEEQLHWCEDKMTKVRLSDRKLQRDPSPLFFPAH